VKNKPRIEQDDAPGGLTHNPFASLKPGGGGGAAGSKPPASKAPEVSTSDAFGGASAGRLVVQREKKGRAGKTVTRVIDCSQLPIEIEQLARQMKRALGCGASVDGADILLQGTLTERAAVWLRKQFGVDVTIGN
jgi:translation initiation factor 1 (eIF-1/SUI1)